MENRHDDTPVINDLTFEIFEEVEKRGLQFALPETWKSVYRAFLKERKFRRELAAAFEEFEKSMSEYWSQSGSYKDDFGSKGAAATEENSKANTSSRPLEE